jgi:hypothetical protein
MTAWDAGLDFGLAHLAAQLPPATPVVVRSSE